MGLRISPINHRFFAKKLNSKQQQRAEDLKKIRANFATKELKEQAISDGKTFNALVDFMWENPQLKQEIQNGNYEFFSIEPRKDSNGNYWNYVSIRTPQGIFDLSRKKYVEFVQINSPNFAFPLERMEGEGDCILNFFKSENSKKNFSFKTNGYNNLLLNQIQLTKKEDGEPEKIIHRQISKEAKGLYNTTEYTLSDYPEDYDVIKGIKSGEIKGGRELSKVIRDDNGIQYRENLKSPSGCTIKREYGINKNGDGQSYSIKIFDENSKPLLILDRSFEQKESGTKTFVNGKAYWAGLNKENGNMRIETEDDSYLLKCSKMVPQKRMQKLLSELPADVLIDICNNVFEVKYYSGVSHVKDGKIYTDKNPASLYHELGHILSTRKFLKNDEKLKEIYEREYNQLISEVPFFAQGIYINYFSPMSLSNTSGLDETIAETYMLLVTPGDFSDRETMTRSQLLIQNFPKTISYIATKLGLNSTNPEF